MPVETIVSVIGGITGIVSLVLVKLKGGRYIGKLDALVERHTLCPIVSVDKEVFVLKARFDMFLTTIERHAPRDLIAPHTPRRDELLDKMTQQKLDVVEAKELLTDLESNMTEFRSDKLLAAILVVVRLKDITNGWS